MKVRQEKAREKLYESASRKSNVQSSKSPLLDASVALENIASFASSYLQVDYLLKRCRNISRGLRSGRLKSQPWSPCFGLGFVRSHGRWLDGNWCNSGGKRCICTTYYLKMPISFRIFILLFQQPQLFLSHPLSQAAAIVHSPHFLPARLKPAIAASKLANAHRLSPSTTSSFISM